MQSIRSDASRFIKQSKKQEAVSYLNNVSTEAPTPRLTPRELHDMAIPYACAQPYHPGSGSHGQLFRPYWCSSAWHSRRVYEQANPCI